jgi:hypothetical protein
MVKVIANEQQFEFKILGWHQFWSFENCIKIDKQNVVKAYQNREMFSSWKWIGWKIPGTSIPGIITAGTFHKKGEKNFWDVMNKDNAIIVELKDSIYNNLFIEVENPEETLNLLNSK